MRRRTRSRAARCWSANCSGLASRVRPWPELLRELELDSAEALHEALGLGEVSAAQVAGAMQRLLHARETRLEHASRAPAAAAHPSVEVQGIGDLLVDLCALLQARAARAHRRLYHGRARREHPQSGLRQSGAAQASSRRRACSRSTGARRGAANFRWTSRCRLSIAAAWCATSAPPWRTRRSRSAA